MMRFRSFIIGFAALAQRSRIVLERVVLIIADELRIGADKAAIENSTRQPPVIVSFNRFEVSNRDSRLLRDVTQSNPPRLACESQLFSDAFCHFDSVGLGSMQGTHKSLSYNRSTSACRQNPSR